MGRTVDNERRTAYRRGRGWGLDGLMPVNPYKRMLRRTESARLADAWMDGWCDGVAERRRTVPANRPIIRGT